MAAPSQFNISVILALLYTLLITISTCNAYKEKMIHLHFYFHEIYQGPNSTAATVVPPAMKNSFGSISIIDDMLKEGPEPSSKLIGRAEGLSSQTSMENELSLLTLLNFVFTDGLYNGSTLSIFGRAVLGNEAIERSIVGGSGQFRMARGYTISSVVSLASPLLVLKYDAYILLPSR